MTVLEDRNISYSGAIADLLGGEEVFGPEPADRARLLSVSEDGLPSESVTFMLSFLDSHAGEYGDAVIWLRGRLDEGFTTTGVLEPSLSNICLRIAALLVALVGKFDDVDKAVGFMLMPHESLHGEAPVQTVFDPEGVKAVDHLVKSALYAMPC
jgi:hypothetical protein